MFLSRITRLQPRRVSYQHLSEETTSFVTQNPLLWVQGRRHGFNVASVHRYHTASGVTLPLERWSNNFARLYARRILELAALSAAAARSTTTQLQATGDSISHPANWAHFEKKDWTDDMLASLGTSSLQRLWLSVSRLVSLGVLVSPMAALFPFTYVSNTAHNWLWDYALFAIEHAGPTWIKFMQWATTRQDLFSQEFCSHFGKLRDNTRGHAWHATQDIMTQELGPQWRDLVQLDHHQPIGSGCIAQVYKGKLKKPTPFYPEGTELAIKVQHPGIWHKVCIDFYLLGKAANFLEAIPGLNLDYLSLRDTVDQFCNVMLPQLDLTIESNNLERFHRDFGADPLVNFPRPLAELTTPKLLVETFMNGKPILDFQKEDLETRKEVAMLGLETTLKMIFLNDFIHGDLHPGNLLVTRNDDGKHALTLLDCGLVIEFGPRQHETVVEILGAFTRRDGNRAAKLMVDKASKCQANDWDVKMFIKGIEQIIVTDAEQNFVEHIGDYITDICYLACRHKVKLEAAFINAALSVEIIEGIASALYPDIQVKTTAMPLVMKAELMHRLPISWSKFRKS